MSVMENLIKWILTRWRHYNLLRSAVGIVMNGTKLLLIKQYVCIQYMWAINLLVKMSLITQRYCIPQHRNQVVFGVCDRSHVITNSLTLLQIND